MLIYWFLPMILFLGIATSYEDFKYGKIRNKWILIGILYSIFVYVFLYISNIEDLQISTLKFTFINSSLALLVGFLMWLLGLWTAGDAKLFSVYSLLLPLDAYRRPSINFFPSLEILVNAFVPFAFILVLILVYSTIKNNKLINFKKLINLKDALSMFTFLLGFSWFLDIFEMSKNIKISIFIDALVLIVIYNILKKFRLNIILISLILLAIKLLNDWHNVLDFKMWRLTYTFLIFMILRFTILNLGYLKFTKEVNFNSLKPGMIPAESIYKIGNKFKKFQERGITDSLFYKSKEINQPFRSNPRGLTMEEIRILKSNLHALPFKRIKIKQTVSFAPALFFGVMVSIIFSIY